MRGGIWPAEKAGRIRHRGVGSGCHRTAEFCADDEDVGSRGAGALGRAARFAGLRRKGPGRRDSEKHGKVASALAQGSVPPSP
ncbi:hypothetical protein MRX96_043245 [Rhipicephalus microplus]